MTITTIKEFVSELTPDITGAEIAQARSALGLTQVEMARVFDVDIAVALQWENGEASPEAPGAVKFALEYFKLSNTLLTDDVFANVEERLAEAQQMLADRQRSRAELQEQLAKYDITPT